MNGKKILLGVTGSIAAYKSILLVRLLKKAGAEVKVIMTPSAREFVSPLVLSTLSGNRVLIEWTSEDHTWENHVALGRWADLIVIAPLSCNTLSKIVSGQCDLLLLAVYLSATCPVMLAPAMDADMWQHQATQSNLEVLRKRGHLICPVEKGELASGLIGEGRMAEPEKIFQLIQQQFETSSEWKGKRILITAGPTYELIDPVRFIGNYSTGKMGIALASVFAERGAEVTLILGPSSEDVPATIHQLIKVRSADDMLNACLQAVSKADLIIMAAAVADYRPIKPRQQKIKKASSVLQLELEPTTDILKTIGLSKKKKQLLVGFALETNDGEKHALQKLASKQADLIILNSLQDEGAGFGTDTNKITIFEKGGKKTAFPLKTKPEVGAAIADHLLKKIHA